jgi:hypothetical protein
MLFPKNRMRFTSSLQGKTEPDGWLELNVKGADLDGVTKIYIPMADVLALKKAGDLSGSRLNAARALLGGNLDEEE